MVELSRKGGEVSRFYVNATSSPLHFICPKTQLKTTFPYWQFSGTRQFNTLSLSTRPTSPEAVSDMARLFPPHGSPPHSETWRASWLEKLTCHFNAWFHSTQCSIITLSVMILSYLQTSVLQTLSHAYHWLQYLAFHKYPIDFIIKTKIYLGGGSSQLFGEGSARTNNCKWHKAHQVKMRFQILYLWQCTDCSL